MLAKSGRLEGLAAHKKLEEGGRWVLKKNYNKKNHNKKKIQSQGSFSTGVMSKDIANCCFQNTNNIIYLYILIQGKIFMILISNKITRMEGDYKRTLYL